jgi:hypothetical protein
MQIRTSAGHEIAAELFAPAGEPRGAALIVPVMGVTQAFYGALASWLAGQGFLTVTFRRPLPSTNLSFISAVKCNGRETVAGETMAQNLGRQANDATLGHAQASAPLTAAQQNSIVAFETALFTSSTSASTRPSSSIWRAPLDSLRELPTPSFDPLHPDRTGPNPEAQPRRLRARGRGFRRVSRPPLRARSRRSRCP